jgi:hypothetical protein
MTKDFGVKVEEYASKTKQQEILLASEKKAKQKLED